MNLLEYWYAALNSPSGICLRVSDAERIRQKLYTARREACDLDLNAISVVISPTDSGELWLVHNGKVVFSE